MFQDLQDGRFYLGNCLELMREIPDGVIDMVLCDLPYGTTQNKWDSVLPLAELWAEYWRVCKPNAAIVLTAAQPFTSVLIMSQLASFKYDWTWRKEKGTGHLNAKKMPMRDKEDICIFYREQATYNPQFGAGKPYKGNARVGKKQQTDNYGNFEAVREDSDGKRYPKQVIEFNSTGRGGFHPTQKPVELWEYLIRTYSNEGELILDNTAGSGTTAIAAINTGRKWVCMEQDETYATKAVERIKSHVKPAVEFTEKVELEAAV